MNPENEIRYGEAFCQTLINDMYREMLPLAWANQKIRATSCLNEWKLRNDAIALKILPLEDAREFVARLDRMREVIGDVMASEPDRIAYIKSLGIDNRNVPILRSQSKRMPLGELAVRTAVRATVWDSVRAIFRMFR